jgi:5-methylcytosine-specific restriction protein A
VTRRTGPSTAVVDAVLERDHWSCLICNEGLAGERGRDWSIGHRIPRGMGGTKDPRINLPSNLLTLCGSGTTGCHGATEGPLRALAYRHGWLLQRHLDPRTVPVLIERGARYVYLTNDCTYADAPPDGP